MGFLLGISPQQNLALLQLHRLKHAPAKVVPALLRTEHNRPTLGAMSNNNVLSRSRNSRMVAGVLGGIAEHFGWDANLLRVVFLVSMLLPGPQLLAYLVAWIIMPDESQF